MSNKKSKTAPDFTVVVMGPGYVGKSSLAVRFTTGTFITNYDPNVEDTFSKQLTVDGKNTAIEIIDTAGQEEFESLYERWVKPANGFLFVYSITAYCTFEEVQSMKSKVVRIWADQKSDSGTKIPMVLCGNKADLEDEREIDTEEGEELAEKWKCKFFETSAKNKTNIDEAMQVLVQEMRKNKAKRTEKKQNNSRQQKRNQGYDNRGSSKQKQKDKDCIVM